MDRDRIAQLEKLADLKLKGILTDDEFQRKKAELLATRQENFPSSIPSSTSPTKDEGTYWLPIPSLVLGILCILALFDDSGWDKDTIAGMALFAVTSLVLGIVSVSKQERGKGMAIAGIVLSSVSLLALIGMQS